MGIQQYAFALFIAALICLIAILCKVLFSDVKRQKKMLDEKESEILRLYTSVETMMEEFHDQMKATTAELKDYEFRATTATTKITEFESAFQLPPELEKKAEAIDKIPKSTPLDGTVRKAAGEAIERAQQIQNQQPSVQPGSSAKSSGTYVNSTQKPLSGTTKPKNEVASAVFQKMFDETAEASPSTVTIAAPRLQADQNSQAGQSSSPESKTALQRDKIISMTGEGVSDVEIARELGITLSQVQLALALEK